MFPCILLDDQGKYVTLALSQPGGLDGTLALQSKSDMNRLTKKNLGCCCAGLLRGPAIRTFLSGLLLFDLSCNVLVITSFGTEYLYGKP